MSNIENQAKAFVDKEWGLFSQIIRDHPKKAFFIGVVLGGSVVWMIAKIIGL